MNLRRAFKRAPAIALAIGLPVAVVAGSGAGCVRSLASAPPPGAENSSSAGIGSDLDGGAQASFDAAGGWTTPAVIGLAVVYDAGLCTPADEPTVGPSPLRRISRVEYDDMVRDLLGDTTQPAQSFVSETPLATGVNLETNTYTNVIGTQIPGQYLTAAQTLAATAVSSNLSTLLTQYASTGCSGGQQTDACAQQFIDAFATQAFRGQYDSDESTDLFDLYSTIKGESSFATGIQGVITAVLSSPRFLYVLEFGQPDAGAGGVVPLAPNELATRLALFLWRSIPDATLLSDAQAGKLSTPAGMQAEVTRMLANSKATSALVDFATQWMELQSTASATKDTQFTAPQTGRLPWSNTLATELLTETTTTYANEVAVEDGGAGGTLSELLSSPESYIDTDLGTFYGVTGASSDFSAKVNVNPPGLNVRAGILTNGSILATQAHTSLPTPVLRGKLVREEVLCEPMQNPPAAVEGKPIPPPPSFPLPPGETTDDSFSQDMTDPNCSTCHEYMDPIGYGFAHFDATGAYQATDSNGEPDAGAYPPIDAGGQVLPKNPQAPGELSVTSFNGAVDLATHLAGSAQVEECYALEQFRYALGRLESNADACSIQQAFESYSQKNYSLQQILVAIAQSDSFQYRTAEVAGSACQ